MTSGSGKTSEIGGLRAKDERERSIQEGLNKPILTFRPGES